MFTFNITPDGGTPFTVTATSRDIAQWEKTTKDASLHQLQEKMRMTDLYKICWIAARRQLPDYVPTVLADFETGFDLEMDEDEPADPSPSAA